MSERIDYRAQYPVEHFHRKLQQTMNKKPVRSDAVALRDIRVIR